MFCSNCGKKLADDTNFCPECGENLSKIKGQVFSNNETDVDMPIYNPTTDNSCAQSATINRGKSMAWYKTLIYFMLFVCLFVNAAFGSVAIMYTGLDPVYYDIDFVNLALLIGVLSIELTILAVVCRFRLAKFKKDSPMLFYIYCAASAFMEIVYFIRYVSTCNLYEYDILFHFSWYRLESFSLWVILLLAILTIVMLLSSVVYFNKRKSLFIK